jgi:hypothetical protein
MFRDPHREIEVDIAPVEKLVAIQPPMERWSLLGSAYKRLVLLQEATAESPARSLALIKYPAHRVGEPRREVAERLLSIPERDRCGSNCWTCCGRSRSGTGKALTPHPLAANR